MNVLLAENGSSQDVAGSIEGVWSKVVSQITELSGQYLPKVAAALAVLIVGWIVALIIAAVVRGAVRRLALHRRLAASLPAEGAPEPPEISRGVGRAVFYLLMLFVLVGFFQTLGLTMVTEPLTSFLNQVFEYAPQLIAAGVLLFLAWLVATSLRFIVAKVLAAIGLDHRLSLGAGVEGEQDVPITRTISEAVYWLVYLLFLPAILDALAIPGLLEPVQDLVTKILAFLPNLFAAAVILGVGWFVALIVRRVVTNLLVAVGSDRLSERVGLEKVLGHNRLSGLLGLIVFVLILVPVVVGSLNALQMDAVTTPASDMLNTMLNALPGIFAATLVIAIAYVVGRVISGLATNLLFGIGFDNLPSRLGLAAETTEGRRTPSQIAGTVIMVAIVLFATMQALPMLGFDLLAGMMAEFLVFASQVLLGLVIFGFGLFFAKFVADLILDSSIANAKLLSMIARVGILVLAGAMALRQMGLAEEIVTIAFGVTLGAIAVAVAIAFGIGGRDAAKKLINDVASRRLGGGE